MAAPRPLRLLLIEDSDDDAELLVRELRRAGFAPEVQRVETRREMVEALARGGFELILSDHRLPHFSATEALELHRESAVDVPFLVCSGSIGETEAVELLRNGAADFFLKDNLARLGAAVDRELREVEGRRARRRADADREEAERARRQSEALLRAFFDSPGAMRGLVEPIDDDVRFLMVNAAAADFLGGTPGALLGSRASGRGWPAPVRGLWLDHMRRCRERAAPAIFEYDRDPGTRLRLRVVLTHVGEADQRDRYAFIAQDVTEEWHAQQALRESEQRFRHIVEAAASGIVAVDGEGCIVLVNERTERMFGYTRAELLGQPVERLVPEAARGRHGADREGFLRNPSTRAMGTGQVEGLRKDGQTFPIEVGLSHFESGGERAALATVLDVSERRVLEQQLRGAQRMEAIGRLAGGIAHDFNNLLGVIGGFGELAQRQLPPDHPIQRRLDQILEASKRAADLTRQLLAFSRQQVMHPRPLDLDAAIQATRAMLERVLGEDVELVSHPGTGLGTVMADPTQIDQVLMNLAVNARDAMPHGGTLRFETANVELDEDYARRHAAGKPGSYVMLAVSDTGVGMDAETQSHIFEPFFTTKEEGRGTGLGLATVYGIVKQSGGFIWVYSEPGRGATFKIYLPRVVDAADAPRDDPAAPSPPERGTETVLIVEDQATLRDMVQEVLELQGYTVLAADGGDTALALARDHPGPIHVLLTDVIMPGMNGRELAERVTALRPATRTVYMSGYSDGTIAERGLLNDDVLLVEKPFTAGALSQAVRRALRR